MSMALLRVRIPAAFNRTAPERSLAAATYGCTCGRRQIGDMESCGRSRRFLALACLGGGLSGSSRVAIGMPYLQERRRTWTGVGGSHEPSSSHARLEGGGGGGRGGGGCAPRGRRRSEAMAILKGVGKMAPPSFQREIAIARTMTWHRRKSNARNGRYVASLEGDAPFAIAIGACLLSSAWPLLLSPLGPSDEERATSELFQDNGKDGFSGADDVRFGVMSVISILPLFNWLAWVFAWLDTNDKRYLVFAAIYLAPYIKSGLSLSPEDSWLPIASVLACALHVQIDYSVSENNSRRPAGSSRSLGFEWAESFEKLKKQIRGILLASSSSSSSSSSRIKEAIAKTFTKEQHLKKKQQEEQVLYDVGVIEEKEEEEEDGDDRDEELAMEREREFREQELRTWDERLRESSKDEFLNQ